MLKDDQINTSLLKGVADSEDRQNNCDGNIEDVRDGQIYNEILKNYPHKSRLVTYNFTIDVSAPTWTQHS